ncbi:MAG: hypothetical protein IPQ04_15225 [Saprospiraceae bacterium]|nr:hypothetical protein [Saprospiraceae bacterium]
MNQSSRLLTHRELESLEEVFKKYLASLGISASEWEKQKGDPAYFEDRIREFSDMVWQSILPKIDHFEFLGNGVWMVLKIEDKNVRMVGLLDKNATPIDFTVTKLDPTMLGKENIFFIQDQKKLEVSSISYKLDLLTKGYIISSEEIFDRFSTILV